MTKTTPTREELIEKYRHEKVAVVWKNQVKLDEGFNPYSKKLYRYICENAFFIRRYNAEYNKKFKQPIAYIVLRHGDKYFITRRLEDSGEPRLVGQIAMGLGGHINPIDAGIEPGNIISNSIIRELHEEVKIHPNAEINSKIIGFINDNSNNVSQDHLGIVCLMDISKPVVEIIEKDNLVGKFVDTAYLEEHYNELESWGQIVFDALKNFVKTEVK